MPSMIFTSKYRQYYLSISIVNNSLIRDYVHPEDHTQPSYEITPGFKPFTVSYYFDYTFLDFCWKQRQLHGCVQHFKTTNHNTLHSNFAGGVAQSDIIED